MIEFNNHQYQSEWHEAPIKSPTTTTTKCGEIFRDNLGSVWLTCGHCNFTEFDTLANYILHISIHFVATSNIKQEIVYPFNNDDYDDDVATHYSSPPPLPSPPQTGDKDETDPFDQIVNVNQATSMMTTPPKIKSKPDQNKLIKVKRKTHHRNVLDLPKFSRIKLSLSCDYCNEVVARNRTELIDHMWKMHRYGYPCPVCDRQFQYLYKVAIHMQTHTRETPRSDLYKHLKVHQAAVEECVAAGGGSNSIKSEPSSSTTAMFSVRGENKEKVVHQNMLCDLPKSLLSRDALRLSCDYCQVIVAVSRRELIDHMWKVHRLGYGCPICNFQFRYLYKVKIHLQTHSAERPYECPVCGLCYAGKASLRSHMKKHASIKEYLCPICGKAFYTGNQFAQHRAVHEKKHSPVDCTHCLRTYRSLALLKKHIRVMHSSLQYICDICSEVMTNRRRLNEHMNIHAGRRPYACRYYCGEGFLNMHTRKTHEKRVHNQTIKA